MPCHHCLGWFAAADSHNRLSQNQAGIIENPGLSYGLFHAVANPISSWGVVRKVTFPGVNMDIGHIRNVSWAKDNDDRKWVAYNRLRGQYMSALEHAMPERFFNDPSQCNLQGTTNPTAGLPDCPQGISAVKALGIAATQGQKIYTITQKVYNENPGIVNTALSAHSYDTQSRVQQSLDAGYEVTIHEQPITESGWTGAGYTQTDPSTGAGAYTIEGGGNGGSLNLDLVSDSQALFLNILATFVGLLGTIGGIFSALLYVFTAVDTYLDLSVNAGCPGFDAIFGLVNFINIYSILLGLAAIPLGLLFGPMAAAILFAIGIVFFW